ncbi:hypothetical protein ACIO6T_22020 [Streptomyces sp. NPDC087532]|uniref:hypothetical protein n=1 Tax=unclassified Streptomyces TaxID=2593676 RepID=UPI00381ED2BC
MTSCPCPHCDEICGLKVAAWIRGHWGIENLLHHVRDRTFREDGSEIRTGHLPRTMASLRNLAISTFRQDGETDVAASDGGHTRIPE